MRGSFLWRGFLVAALAGVFFTLCVSAAHNESQTYDEGFHLLAGYRYLECRDFAMNSEHPPLVKILAALPVRLSHMPRPDGTCGVEPTTKDYGYAQGMHWFYAQPGVSAEALLWRGRVAASVLGVLLVLSIFWFARSLFGYWPGVFAMAVAVFDTAFLAHAPRVTTDVAMALFLLLSVFAAYNWFRTRALSRLLLCGLALGCLLASKHSGVLGVLVLCLLFGWEGWRGQPGTAAQRRIRGVLVQLGAYACVLLLALFVLWGFYDFSFTGRPHGAAMTLPLPGFLKLVYEQNTHGFMVDWLVPLAYRLHLAPLPYLYGLTDVWAVSHPGQPVFLLGKFYPHGVWFYFPLVFSMKTTLAFPALLLMAAGGWAVRLRGASAEQRAFAWRQLRFLLVPCAVIFSIAMTSGLDIGFRHILAIMPLLYCCIAGGVGVLWPRDRAWRVIACLLVAFQAEEALRAWPNYMPYVNQAWGGSSNAWRLTTDANVDWGQQLLEIRDWVNKNNVKDCWLAMDNAVDLKHFGIPCRFLPGNEWIPGSVPPVDISGHVVLTGLSLAGIEFEYNQNPYVQFYSLKPVTNIGNAAPVFAGSFHLPQARAVALVVRAQGEMDSNPAAALLDVEESLALYPQSVRAHIAYGEVLKKAGRRADAVREFQAALSLIQQAGEVWYPLEKQQAGDALRAMEAK